MKFMIIHQNKKLYNHLWLISNQLERKLTKLLIMLLGLRLTLLGLLTKLLNLAHSQKHL